MKHKTTQSLFDYWNGLRGSRMAPHRFEIEPAGMGHALPDTFILERQDAGTFPFRLAGTRLCDRFKREFRGHNFLDAWSPADGLKLQARLNTISVQGGGVLVLADAETGTGKVALVEILILPLMHGQASADRFLGVLSPIDAPDWLGYEAISQLHLRSDEIIWPDGQTEHIDPATEDRQSPFLPRVRHARIVRSDRRQFRVFDGGLSVSQEIVTPKS